MIRISPVTLRTSLILAAACAAALAESAPSRYAIANRFPVSGDEHWDFLVADGAGGRIYVSHGNQTQILDEKTGKVVGVIPETKGVHGIALAEEAGKGYISNGKDTSVTVFDLKSLATLGKVRTTGINPDAILYDPFSRHVFAFNGKSANATVIDPKTDKAIGTIDVGGKPEVAVSDGKGTLYLNLEDKNSLAVLDAALGKVSKTWSLSPCEGPSGLALDNGAHRLFSVCGNKMMVVTDIATGKVIAELPIGEGADGAAFDPEKKRVYSSNGDGTLTVVQEDGKGGYAVLETVATRKGAKTLALDAKTHHVFLSTAEFGPAPAPTPENPKSKPAIKPGTFVVLDIEPI